MMGANNRCPAQHVPLVGSLSKKKKKRDRTLYSVRSLHSFVGETEAFIGSFFVLHWHWPTWAPRVPQIKTDR